MKKSLFQHVVIVVVMVAMSGCSTTPPANPENLCDIFREKSDWYKDSVRMSEKWGVPIQVPMAMMYQESSFRHDAKPPKDYIFFGLIPWGRVSSAYGYSQAKTMTWADYQRETGQSGSRSDFGDAIDFMGWFITKTHKINGVSKWDAYAQYLNYHEGWGGYRRKTYNRKAWLKDVARKVERRASTYGTQLRSCKDELDGGFWNWLFG